MNATMARWTRLARVKVRVRVSVRVRVRIRVRVRVRVRVGVKVRVRFRFVWGAVDAPTRLAVGKGEEMRPAFLEEELECDAPQQIATRHQLPQQREAPHALPHRRVALPLAVAHPAGDTYFVHLGPLRRRGGDLLRARVRVRVRVRVQGKVRVRIRVRVKVRRGRYHVRYEAQSLRA